MNNDQRINQDSGLTEYYTPSRFIESSRKVLGGIDLDPASCEIANRTVQARRFFTKEDDGLSKEWTGRVWMNHPFSKGELPCKKFKIKEKIGQYNCITKLINSYERGGILSSINICYASTSEDWFIPLLDYPQCFIAKRVNYFKPDGTEAKGVTKGSVITYLGDDYLSFKREFSQYGKVK